jgi:cell division protease FtsH
VTQHKNVSDETALAIDREIRAIVEVNFQRAKQILQDNRDRLQLMADALMKYETIDARQIKEIMQGREPGPPESWEDSGPAQPGSGLPVSDAKPAPAAASKPASQH